MVVYTGDSWIMNTISRVRLRVQSILTYAF